MTATDPKAPLRGARLALLIAGIAGIVAGIVILAWPTKAAVAVAAIIAGYAIFSGLTYIVMGVLSRSFETIGKIGHIALGVLYVAAGIFALVEIQASAAFLAIFVSIAIGLTWIIEGVVALFTLRIREAKLFTIVFAVVSILGGLILVTSPLWSALLLWWLLGVALLALGALNVMRAALGRTSW
ncbi:DUF308 domain-containing protein [Brachybacterium hainanense]|uniref:DUF308 domain-containing protein n=1 Tax=Brachybacterium hainanense TaxID=1541174 RepID=A0ABV6RFL2_9MICO